MLPPPSPPPEPVPFRTLPRLIRLVPLLPPALAPWLGPILGLPVLEAYLIALSLVVLMLRTRHVAGPRRPPAPALRYLVLFAAAGAFSFLLLCTSDPMESLLGELFVLLRACLVLAPTYYLFTTLPRDARDCRLLLLLVFFAGVAFIGFSAFSTPEGLWSPLARLSEYGRTRRYFVPSYELPVSATVLGLHATLLVPLAYAGLFLGGRLTRAAVLGAAALLLVALATMGTRFTWAATVGALLIAYWPHRHAASLRRRLPIIIGLLLVVAGLFAWQRPRVALDDELLRRSRSLLDVRELLADHSLQSRFELWSLGAVDVATAPFGRGYLYFVTHEDLGVHPLFGDVVGANTHNEFLLIALGTGWMGFILFVLALRTLARWFLAVRRRGAPLAGASAVTGLMLLLCFGVGGTFDTYSNNASTLCPLALLCMELGLVVALAQRAGP